MMQKTRAAALAMTVLTLVGCGGQLPAVAPQAPIAPAAANGDVSTYKGAGWGRLDARLKSLFPGKTITYLDRRPSNAFWGGPLLFVIVVDGTRISGKYRDGSDKLEFDTPVTPGTIDVPGIRAEITSQLKEFHPRAAITIAQLDEKPKGYVHSFKATVNGQTVQGTFDRSTWKMRLGA